MNQPPPSSLGFYFGQKRETYLSALVKIQHQLLATPEAEINYRHILSLLGEASGASQILVFENHTQSWGGVFAVQKSCWHGVGVCADHPLSFNHQTFFYQDSFPRWYEILASGQYICSLSQDLPISEQILLDYQGVKGILVLPLIMNGDFFGFIRFDHNFADRHWQPEDLNFLMMAVQSLSFAWQQQQIKLEKIERSQQAALSSDISFALTQSQNLQELLDCCVEATIQHLNVTTACVWIVNHKKKALELKACAGICSYIKNNYQTIPLGELQVGKIAQNRQPYLSNNILADTEIQLQQWAIAEELNAFAGYPLMIEDEVIGVMMILSRQILNKITFQTLSSLVEQVAIGIDVKQKEEKLRKSQARYQAIVEDQTDLICRFLPDRHSTFTFVNYTFCRYFDLANVPERWSNIFGFMIDPEIVSHDLNSLFSLTPESPVLIREHQLSIKDEIRWLQWTYRAIFNDQNLIHEFQAIGRDITDLIQAKETALEAVQMKAQFLATMSHEIRTPMNGVIGMTEILANTPLNPQQQEFIETLKSSSHNLLTLINEILDFSKLEAGEVVLETIDFDLNHCIVEIIDVLSYQAQQKGIQLAYLLDENIPLFVKGDPTRLRQVLMNLIGNAIKFTEQGSVTVKISEALKLNQDRIALNFAIIDTGIGIAPEDQDKLFQSFAQVDLSTTRKYGGTGLGLAIAQQLVELMGGEIKVKSQKGQGSTFDFTLSFAPQKFSLVQTSALNGMKLLLIDQSAFSNIVKAYSTAWQINCTHIQSLEEALELFYENDYDTVLIDSNCFAGDSKTLGTFMRLIPQWEDLKWVVMLPQDQHHHIKSFLNQGVNNYLFQPIRGDRLRESLTQGMIACPLNGDSFLDLSIEKSSAKILVVEDTQINQMVILNQLKILGYHADCVNNGQEALEILQKQTYDLILMDCLMPVLDGYETTQKLRQIEEDERHTIVIALSANAFIEDQEKCLAYGMDDYLSKPITLDQLEKCLLHWLEDSERNNHQPQKVNSSMMQPYQDLTLEELINFHHLIEITAGDLDFQKQLLSTFATESQNYLTEIEKALNSHNYHKLHHHAHQLKGASRMAGIKIIPDLTREIEILSQYEDLSQVHDLITEIKQVLEQLNYYLNNNFFLDKKLTNNLLSQYSVS